jgi:hypothetical protein
MNEKAAKASLKGRRSGARSFIHKNEAETGSDEQKLKIERQDFDKIKKEIAELETKILRRSSR